MTRKAKTFSIEKTEAEREAAAMRREDDFMLRDGHMTFFYDAWYERRGKGIIEARDKARADRQSLAIGWGCWTGATGPQIRASPHC